MIKEQFLCCLTSTLGKHTFQTRIELNSPCEICARSMVELSTRLNASCLWSIYLWQFCITLMLDRGIIQISSVRHRSSMVQTLLSSWVMKLQASSQVMDFWRWEKSSYFTGVCSVWALTCSPCPKMEMEAILKLKLLFRKNCPIAVTLLLCKLMDNHQTCSTPITSPKQKKVIWLHHQNKLWFKHITNNKTASI